MSEKMLMTQALDERDLLVKKINDKIEKIRLVDVKNATKKKPLRAVTLLKNLSKIQNLLFSRSPILLNAIRDSIPLSLHPMHRHGLKPAMENILLPVQSHCETV